jgi:hypothetical protein
LWKSSYLQNLQHYLWNGNFLAESLFPELDFPPEQNRKDMRNHLEIDIEIASYLQHKKNSFHYHYHLKEYPKSAVLTLDIAKYLYPETHQ